MKISNQHIAMMANQGQKTDKALRQACADFESLITNQMLTAMRNSLPQEEDSLFAKSYGEEMFQSMLDEELSKEMATGRGTGLGEMLYKELAKDRPKSEG